MLNREGRLDDYDNLHIGNRLAAGSCTDPVSLCWLASAPVQEMLPGLSPDRKHLFFCRNTLGHNGDVYCVDVASIPALRSAATLPKENPK